MRIGIDGILLRPRNAGTLRYLELLLEGLAECGPQNEYIVFVDKRALPPKTFAHLKGIRFEDIHGNRWLPRGLVQQSFPFWRIPRNLDLVHSSALVCPLLFTGKMVTTVHDLTFELYPYTMKWTGRLWFRLLARKGMERSHRIIAVSESTKRDLIRHYGIDAGKIRVIHHYVHPGFGRPAGAEAIARKYGLPDRYVLYVGTLERRKNLANLVRAFAETIKSEPLRHALVIAGQRGWLYDDIFRTVEELGVRNRVIFLGYVPDEDLPALYSGADLFTYLSWYEGFGLPVLEAMACGTPVLASNRSSLPEIVGDAGVLVPPDDVEQISCEMTRILSSPDLRDDMRQKGVNRAKLFSQEQFSRQVLQVYDEAVSN